MIYSKQFLTSTRGYLLANAIFSLPWGLLVNMYECKHLCLLICINTFIGIHVPFTHIFIVHHVSTIYHSSSMSNINIKCLVLPFFSKLFIQYKTRMLSEIHKYVVVLLCHQLKIIRIKII